MEKNNARVAVILNEMKKELAIMGWSSYDEMYHYGTKRHSGRYPWGSGDSKYQHSGDFLSRVEELHSNGLSEADIAKALEMSTGELRTYKQVAKTERRRLEVDQAKAWKSDGLSTSEIARRLGKNESSVRSLLNEDAEIRMNQAQKTADTLRKLVDEKGAIDVGAGVEKELGVSRTKLDEALIILEAEGYPVHGVGITQLTNSNQQTNVKALCKPGIEQSELYKDPGMIKSATDYISKDGGDTFVPNVFQYPASLDGKRVLIRYAEEGGVERDGTIELRRGVEDISLGNSSYAQVRVLVDGTHYLKGMALYSDNIPDGYDVIFNTNKKQGTPPEKVFKKIKTDDPNDPFGSYISPKGQRTYVDENGETKLSVINKVREEGEWDTWSKSLSSQFLGKQSEQLIQKQLDLTYKTKLDEFNDIMSLTNPTVKRNLLDSFADDCDGAAVHLKAAALPRQKAQVILPITTLKDNEIYAPNFRTGEQVALVRFPHGGTFEIPVLTVNNKHRDAKHILGDAIDAVGINSKVAERLSGADFDGDTVVVIPTNNKNKIISTSPLKGLEGFDPKLEYSYSDAELASGKVKLMSSRNKQMEMGKVSNLITDMTLKGATEEELARAVRHSMVVIDAEKHKLNYKKSYEDNDIASLKTKYQGHFKEDGSYSEGASTILSRSSAEVQVRKRKGDPNINPVTGEKTYKEVSYIDPKTGKVVTKASKEVVETYVNKSGKTVERTQSSKQMLEVNDASKLSSGTQKEEYYVNYANAMKSLANQARKEAYSTGRLKYSPEAAEKYAAEKKSLSEKLDIAELNAPRERQAQILATSKVKAIRQDNPDIDSGELKKIKQRELASARVKTGASGKETRIHITDKEWEAIQAGAISDSKLQKIITKADKDEVRKLATPRPTTTLPPAKVNRIKAMRAAGYTTADIADAVGVSTSTINKYR